MKYRRKSIVVEAEQFLYDKSPWPHGVTQLNPDWHELRTNSNAIQRRFQFIGEGAFAINSGDWVITNPTGEKYVVKKEIFHNTYNMVK